MAKETQKNKKQSEVKIDKDEIKKKLKKASDEVMKKVDFLKKKFDDADPEAKKKIVAGLSTVAAGLVLLAGFKKHKKKK